MTTMALKLLCNASDLGYLRLGHVVLNWRGKFLQAQVKFPRELALVDLLLEELLVEQDLGNLDLEFLTDTRKTFPILTERQGPRTAFRCGDQSKAE